MISLASWVACVGVRIGAPKQSGLHHTHGPAQIYRGSLKTGIRGYMEHADNALAPHGGKIRTHPQVHRRIATQGSCSVIANSRSFSDSTRVRVTVCNEKSAPASAP